MQLPEAIQDLSTQPLSGQVSRRGLLAAVAAVSAVAFSGCETATRRRPAGTRPALELPVAGVPMSLRQQNWGGGSCVFASLVNVLRRLNELDRADYVRKTYSGGESYNGLVSKMNRMGIPFYSVAGGGGQDVARRAWQLVSATADCGYKMYGTAAGDVDALERCTADRRGSIIFYYTQHSIMFCGFGASLLGRSGRFAHVLDNNRIRDYIEIPIDEFVRKWRGYGGVSVTPVIGSPPPPTPWIA